jgi:hypothetical protein
MAQAGCQGTPTFQKTWCCRIEINRCTHMSAARTANGSKRSNATIQNCIKKRFNDLSGAGRFSDEGVLSQRALAPFCFDQTNAPAIRVKVEPRIPRATLRNMKVAMPRARRRSGAAAIRLVKARLQSPISRTKTPAPRADPMVKTHATAQPGKRIGKHGGNRSGHHANGANKVGRASRQAVGKDPHRGRRKGHAGSRPGSHR